MNFNINETNKFSLDKKVLKRLDRFLDIISSSKEEETDVLTVIKVVDVDTGMTFEGEINKMVLTDSQKVTIEFGAPLDKKGFPAKVQDGSVTFAISDDSATVTQDAANPLKALVEAVHPHADGASALITISADADLGEGVKAITGVEPLAVINGEAFGFGAATVGTPEEQ